MRDKLFILIILIFVVQNLGAQNELRFSRATLMGQNDPEIYSKSNGLIPQVADAFEKMRNAALIAGFDIKIVSAYRSYDRQTTIWNRKFKANKSKGLSPEENIKKIIEYSTLPGTSRHHWGTDIDIIDGFKPRKGDLLLTEKFHGNGPYAPLRLWLDKNAAKFGFVRPYTNDFEREGFKYEPWHYSYAPLAIPMLKSYLKLDLSRLLIPQTLEGRDHISPAFLNKYIRENVLGISSSLK